jgi:hypothetical protein
MKGSRTIAKITNGRKPPILIHQLSVHRKGNNLPKANTIWRRHRAQFTFELVTQSELFVSHFPVYIQGTHTNNAKTPRDDPINMPNRPLTHSPPSPPYPNIFFERWPLAPRPDIYFSLNPFYSLPTFFLFFFII